MTRPTRILAAFALLLSALPAARADAPVASYLFPAGGRRGTTVDVRVGGLNLHKTCTLDLVGPGVTTEPRLQRIKTLWFEGPLLPLPDSQQAEDYPRDMAGRIQIAADAPLGLRSWRLATSQGATPARKFIVGDLPEIVEQEIDGTPIPVEVQLPVTINGRIFPREDVDVWNFAAHKGQTISCEVYAARLGSPLDSRLEVLDPEGRRIAENDDAFGADSFLRFTAPVDGKYQVRIHDVNFQGGPAYVYRLTLTAEPYVDRVYPLGGRRGEKVRLELFGQGLPREPVELSIPADAQRDHAFRLPVGSTFTNSMLLDVDDLPEHYEVEPNDDRAQVKPVPIPAVLNGRIDRPGDVDYSAFTATKGQLLDLEVRAARLGSPLEALLVLLDASGKELASSEQAGNSAGDPILHFTAPADGTYFVRLADRFRSRGGPSFAYRLRIAPPPPADFRLALAVDALTLPRGGDVKLKVTAERLAGFAGPIPLVVEGLPPGVTAAATTIQAGQNAADITFKAAAAARIQTAHLSVRGTALDHARTAVLPAPRGSPELDSVLLAVALPTPFKIVGDYDMRWAARGTMHHRHYRIERNGFEGPLEVSVADHQARHLQGVTGPTIAVPAGATEFDYPVFLPPWMETGRTSRTCIMAVGFVKDADGSDHEVSFTSIAQNEQVVAVIEPGRLGVEVDKPTLILELDSTVSLPVRVVRGKGLIGPARVELLVPAHIGCIACEAVTLAADEQLATLKVHFAGAPPKQPNLALMVRATVLERADPVVGEARIELRPAR